MSRVNGLEDNSKVFNKLKDCNNCYTYAINRPGDGDRDSWEFCQPGNLDGWNQANFFHPNYPCSSDKTAVLNLGRLLIKRAREDLNRIGYKITESTLEHVVDDNKSWKIALVAGGGDYHWYRQNTNGLWSHKMGSLKVSFKDDDGNVIIDPQTCNRGKYEVFIGYYMIIPKEDYIVTTTKKGGFLKTILNTIRIKKVEVLK